MHHLAIAPMQDRHETAPAASRALPLLGATAAAATLGGPAEASRHAALRRVPQGPGGGLRMLRGLR